MRFLVLFLFSITTAFAQLPASGSLSIKNAAGEGRSISQEVDGNETGNKSLSTLGASAGFSSPYSMLDFYGYAFGGTPTNPNFTFTDDVDRGGGICESVIRDGTSYSGHFTPPTGYSITEWAIVRTEKSKTVHVRGTGNTVTWTPDWKPLDSCNVYDLYAKFSNGSNEYTFRSPAEFWVWPVEPESFTATWSTSQQQDFNWTDHAGDAYKITGDISTRFGLWELQSSDPANPVHIVCENATITADNAFNVFEIGPWKNVILDGCTGSGYGLTLVKPATGTQGQFFFNTNNTSTTQLSSGVWIAGVHAYSPTVRSGATSVASFRTNTVKNSTVNESNYAVTDYIIAETKVTNAGVEGHYHGQSNDAIESGRRYPPFKGMLFFNNIVDGAGNDGFQMQQQMYADYNGNGYYDPKSEEWDTTPKDDPAMFFHNEGYNVGQHNTSDHYNLFQFTPAHVGSIAFGNYGETTHNTVYLNNGTHGQDFEFFSNVTYSTGRDASVGVNYFMSLTNGDSTTAVAIFKNNTSQVASGDMFTLFHGATTTDYDKLYVKGNAFINNTGEDWELGGSGWDTANEIDFDNITVTDIATLEFLDGAAKDYRPATIDGPLWADHGTVPSKTFYSKYDFDGYKFVDTAPIAGAFSGVPTLIADGLPTVTYTITSVDASTPISVANGTAWPPATLPTQVTANLSNGSTRSIDVSWVQGSYDGNVADTYTLTGTLTNLPSDVTNPSSFTGSIDVTVEEEEGFDADYQAVLDRATTLGYTLPSSGDQILQNQLVLDLKSAGIWAKLDIFYVFATDGSSNFSLLNWKAPSSFQATLSGTAPTFTSNSGWAGNGFSSFMDLNWTPSTNGVQYTQNDAAILVGVATNVSSNTDVEFGATQGGFTNRTTLNTRTTSNTAFIAINGNNTTEISNASSVGNYILQRTSSTAVKLFKDGSQLGSTASLSSTGRPTAEMHLLEETNVGNQSARRITHFGAGASLNGLESAFNTAWTTYMSGL